MSKLKKVTISMPYEKWEILSERAKESGMKFSQFMTNSASDVIRYDLTPVRASKKVNK